MPLHPLPDDKLSCACGWCRTCKERARSRLDAQRVRAGLPPLVRKSGRPRSTALKCACGHCKSCWARERARRIVDAKSANMPELVRRTMPVRDSADRLEACFARRRAAWAQRIAEVMAP